MDALSSQSSMIKAEAIRLGFGSCGISNAVSPRGFARLTQWLEAHHHAGMSYMENHIDKRTDPARLVEGANRSYPSFLTIIQRPDHPILKPPLYPPMHTAGIIMR